MEHIIWSNTNIDIKDWSDFLQEEYPEVTDPNEHDEPTYCPVCGHSDCIADG